ncbi:MAG: YihY/virulence factor BrkB family protein, partial [Clostridia bacterium]|nr:YihY/virulence factor BrkB family protein [Clostridia bacterium]
NYLLQLPGAVFTSVSWSAFSFFFSLYINGMYNYTVFYGSLATVTIFLFWLYGCFFILLVGGSINCLFEPQIRRLVFREGAKRPEKEK